MTKTGLIKALGKEARLTRGKSEAAIETLFDTIADALATGDRVEIRGFCSFYVKDYKPYSGRNPKTGETIQVKPKKLPFFKCGKELKKRIDYKQI